VGILCETVARGIVYRHPHSDPYARDADTNFNHAPSVVLMPDGRVLAMWFSAPWEGHHWQVLMQSCSDDGGTTWSQGEVFQDTHGLPDFDPAFIRDGARVWLSFAYAARYAKLAGEPVGRLGCFARYTDDSGATWSEIEEVCAPEGPRTNGIVLSNGDLAIGIHSRETCAALLKSSDHGGTWRRCGRIVAPHGHTEPTLVELKDGTLLMYLRNSSGYIWQTRSSDQGQTWSEPEQTRIVANSSSYCLYRLHDGRIALAYNPCPRRVRTPLVVRFSEDEARSWSGPFALDQIALPRGVPGRGAVTYPSLTENGQGDLAAVWARYWVTEREHCGDICFARLRT